MPRLNNDQIFPNLAVPAVGGGTINLPQDLAGSYGVILIYRGHWCPFCNEQMAAFASATEAVKQTGIKVVAFSVDNEDATKDLIAKHNIPFKVGHSADLNKVVVETGAYQSKHPELGSYLDNTGFVLAPDGKVVNAVYSSRAIGRLIPNDVIRLVSFMKSQVK